MPRGKKKKPCPEGAKCRFQHEHQHIAEYSHGDESEKIAERKKLRAANEWKRSKGHVLGSSRPSKSVKRPRALGISTGYTLGCGTSSSSKPQNSSEAAREAAILRQSRSKSLLCSTTISTSKSGSMLTLKSAGIIEANERKEKAPPTLCDSVVGEYRKNTNGNDDEIDVIEVGNTSQEKKVQRVVWSCAACTFENHTDTLVCEMCGTSKQIY